MYISKLTLVNYKNFKNTSLRFHKGVNTIIGENGSGNLTSCELFASCLTTIWCVLLIVWKRAISADHSTNGRDTGSSSAWSLTRSPLMNPFRHSFSTVRLPWTMGQYIRPHIISFSDPKDIRLKLAALELFDFKELSEIRDAITIDDYETLFTGRSSADFGNPAVYRSIVGDFDICDFSSETEFPEIGAKVPGFLSVTKEVSLTFIQALRDVVSEFHNNRTNPLLTLLKSKSGDINPLTMEPISEMVRGLNASIEGLEDVQSVRNHIRETIKDAAGETYSLLHSQSSQISLKKQINFFSPCDYSLVNQKKGTKVQFMS
jgi:putative ATP-dependent endonuclease of OLD family